MKSTVLIIFLLVISSVLCLPRQDVENKNQGVLDDPLNDPEIRRTLLRVFSESLRSAALTRVPGLRSAANVPVEEIIDVSTPTTGARSDDKSNQELLLLSDSPKSRSDFNFNPAPQRNIDTSLEIEQRGHEGDELVSFNFNTEVNFNQHSSNHGPIDRQSTAENETSTMMKDQLKAPGPSPAPPSPTLAAEDITTMTQLSPADKSDVQRFVSAVRTSNSTDEKLGDDVELFRAPLIAAFALQQDGDTGRTRSLYALPVARGITEELLKSETQTLSVAGQVVGSQSNGIVTAESAFRQPQVHNFGRTQFTIQPSLQSSNQQQQFSQFTSNPNSFLNNEVDPLREIERRQLELQLQILRLQRERSELILNRNTRSGENLQSSASDFNNVYRIPNYLQPPFF